MPEGICSVSGCSKPIHARGWCSSHYERWRRNGHPGLAGDARRRPPPGPCAADDCETVAVKRGLCEKHYRRLHNYGRLDLLRENYGSYRVSTAGGYVAVWCPEHPCAQSDGYALEHRKVWHDARGPIPDGWHVHHKNGDKVDNRIENLEILSACDHARQHLAENGYVRNQFGVWPVGMGG